MIISGFVSFTRIRRMLSRRRLGVSLSAIAPRRPTWCRGVFIDERYSYRKVCRNRRKCGSE